jgi:hypothetical protein
MKAKAFIFYGAALLILGALFAWVVLNTQRGPLPGEDLYPSLVVARVDGVEILAEELNRLVNLSDQGSITDAAQRRRIQGDALDWLINRQLVYNEGKRRKIEITPEEVEQRLQDYYQNNGGEQYVLEKLTAGNRSVEDLREELELGALMIKIRESVQNELREKIVVTDDDIKKFYEENKDTRYTKMEIEYLFIEMTERDEEHKAKALELTDEILEEIDEGRTFTELAAGHADVEGIRISTGKFRESDQVAEILWNAATKLGVGEHTREPIDFINSGYQILKCLSKRVIPIEEVRDSIRERLNAAKLNEAVSDYFKSLRNKAKVEVFLK